MTDTNPPADRTAEFPLGHDFWPVNGHPDDDECTYRSDGTDDTYCGEPRVSHECADSTTAPDSEMDPFEAADEMYRRWE